MSLVADLSENQIQEAREVFQYYARDDSSLSGAKLQKALRSCGVNPTIREINKVTGGGNDVDFPSFLEVVGTSAHEDTKGEILAAFQALDTKGTGKIPGEDLMFMLGNTMDKLSKSELKFAKSAAGSGSVDYVKFVDKMFSGLPEVGSGGGSSSSSGGGGGGSSAAPAPSGGGGDDFGGDGFGDDDFGGDGFGDDGGGDDDDFGF
eukprot:m.97068 g.97068  ORF g.97068 m.97068 type:complete len:205 (-) comp13576_c0_seq1:93-707(-)